jgi:hypothetical protein
LHFHKAEDPPQLFSPLYLSDYPSLLFPIPSFLSFFTVFSSDLSSTPRVLYDPSTLRPTPITTRGGFIFLLGHAGLSLTKMSWLAGQEKQGHEASDNLGVDWVLQYEFGDIGKIYDT